MDNEVISYIEMCGREGASLQRGMNFFAERPHSVVLMSLREDAPYADRIEEDGRTLIYEGHDAPRSKGGPEPKTADQPGQFPSGTPTENGRFWKAATDAAAGRQAPRAVRVYEKLHKGIWSFNGSFLLQDAWKESDGVREVFKFKLELLEEPSDRVADAEFAQRRLIPTAVKLAVWRRDGGRCARCGKDTGLHFDHVLPYSRGGSSVTAENIQLLCARHNLQKSDRIE